MASSTAIIMAFVYAIIILVISGILPTFIPPLDLFRGIISGLGVASVIIFPISAYFTIMAVSFFSALLYNYLAHKLGGIKLGLKGNEITQISIMRFSVILASIEAIWAFIIGLFLAAAIVPFTTIISIIIHVIARNIAHIIDISGATLLIDSALSTNGITMAIVLIIGLPVIVFIFGLVSNALFAIFYNYMATRIIRIQLEFEAISQNLHEIKSMPVVPAAAPLSGAVFAAFGVIMGLISLLSLAATGNPSVGNLANDLAVIVLNGISYFVGYFLIFALIAVIYNFLAPRIGGIRLDLE